MRHVRRLSPPSAGKLPSDIVKRAPISHGFSLLEMLVVIGLIAVLTALTLPSLKGLLGVGGRAGGASVVQSALEQARLAALETGLTTYVGFPMDVADKEAAYSSIILFREPTPEEATAGKAYVPLSRWLRLPQGIYLQEGEDFAARTTNISAQALATQLPKLSTSSGPVAIDKVRAIAFDRFGKLKHAGAPVDFLVGEKSGPTNSFLGQTNNFIQLTVQPLTGRVRVVDRGRENNS
jgi:prepilin-type N-terminal cleavage/methylation domain-containing protein